MPIWFYAGLVCLVVLVRCLYDCLVCDAVAG